MVVMMVSLSGLLALAAVTLTQVKRGANSTSQARFQSSALFAAESGLSAGMEFLRANYSPTFYYSDWVGPNNNPVQSPGGIVGNNIAGNNAAPGESANPFSGDVPMSYTVSILNNASDPAFATGADQDGVVILRSEGRGPGNSLVVLEAEVGDTSGLNLGRPCPGYAQKGIAEDGAGRNDCLKDIDFTVVEEFTPGG